MITTSFKLTKAIPVNALGKAMLTFGFAFFLLFSLNARTYVWTGAGSDNLWSNPDNWEFGNGDPVLAADLPMSAGDDAQITGGIGIPQLTMNENIGSILISANGLDLNGFTLSAGSMDVSAGIISDGSLSPPSVSFDISGNVSISGGTFTNIIKIDGGNFPTLTDAIFTTDVTLEKTGGNNMGNPGDNMTYQGNFTFNKTGSGNVRFGRSAVNTYQGNATLINGGGGGNMTFGEDFVAAVSGNLTATHGTAGSFEIGTSGGGAAVGGAFAMLSSSGNVLLRSVTETTPGFITFIGEDFEADFCIFRGPVSVQADNDILSLNSSQFLNASNSFIADADSDGSGDIGSASNSTFGPSTGGGSTTFSNGLSSSNPWNGGNTFNSDVSFIRTGSTNGNWRLDVGNANTFGSASNPVDVTINNGTGTGNFTFAEQGATIFGDLTVTGTPKSAGGVVTMAGTTGAQIITGADDWEFPTLTVTNTMGVSIDFTFNVTSALNLSGVLEVPTDKVAILGGGATFTGDEDGYVSGGAVQKLGNTATDSSPAFTFHVGADGFYAPFEYTTSNAGGNPEVTVQYTRPGPGPSSPPAPLELVSQTEQWLLTVDDTQIGNTVITLPYGVQSGAIGDEADLRVAFSADGGSSWTNLAGSAGSGEIIGNAQTFSAGSSYIVTLASIDAVQTPLPVELVYFEAEAEEKAVQLRWATASELNNDYFQIERSADGIQFDPIGSPIEGAGTTTEPLNYEYTDINPLSGISYYRLKQVDFGGQSAYSKVAPVRVGGAANNQMLIYPNPVQGQLQVIWGGDQDIERIRLLDAKGQELSIDAIIDNKQAKVELQALTPGVYFLELLSGQERKIEKIVIQ